MNPVIPRYEWKDVPWPKVERAVFKLQKRIYQASQRGDTRQVHKLQRLLMKSHSAALLATRRVTQDNAGKKTAGVDGVKSLKPAQRLTLADELQTQPFTHSPRPVRRVWIPKPGTKDEKRGLGIPVMSDRAQQALAKLALEPQWEAQFEPNSYGFRPGRGCHDAIAAIFLAVRNKAKYVLDADIAKCFDRINHTALLAKLNSFPQLSRLIRGWLKAGIMEGVEFTPSEEGCPQGGVISPLLMNIALHGLEEHLNEQLSHKTTNPYQRILRPILVRYADDLVVITEELPMVEQAKTVVAGWLTPMGLELKPSKTRIVHTLDAHEGQNPGFDFLGFEIRQHRVGKTHSAHSSNGQLLGFKTIIRPSKAKVKDHLHRVKEMIHRHYSAPQTDLIRHLNPLIRGWTNYYRTVCSKATFNRCDYLVYLKLRSWANRRHPNKSGHWKASKYWKAHWRFSSGSQTLTRYSETAIVRHIKVAGKRTPYDGDWVYWTTRMGRHPQANKQVAYLLKRQKGRCAYCQRYFRSGDKLEQDHILPPKQGGGWGLENRQLLHRHCHDRKTAQDGSYRRSNKRQQGRHLMTISQSIEEPLAGKLA